MPDIGLSTSIASQPLATPEVCRLRHRLITHAQLKRWSTIVAALAGFGGVLAVVILCWKWSGKLDIKNDPGDDVCRWGILLSTAVGLVALLHYYSLYWQEAWFRKHASALEHDIDRRHESGSHSSLFYSPLRIKGMLLFEIILLLIQPPPLLHLSEEVVCDLCMLMSVRLWFVARALRDSNPEYVAAVLQRRVLGALTSHRKIPWTFSLRATFARKPWTVLCCVVGTGYVMTAIFIWVAERDVQPEAFTLAESFWFIGVTMTTVGFGDRWPHSPLGQIIALGACVYGINGTALLLTTTIKTFTLDAHETYLIQSIELSKAYRAEREAAARFIQFCVRKWRIQNSGRLHSDGQGRLVRTSSIMQMLQIGKLVRTSVHSSCLVGNLRRCRQARMRICEDLNDANFQRDTSQRLDELAKGQQDILEKLTQLEKVISQLPGLHSST